MKKIILCGCGGRMGKVVADLCAKRENIQICAGVDPAMPACDFPVYSSCAEVKETPDVIIDFSFHTAIGGILAFATKNNVPVVVAALINEEL